MSPDTPVWRCLDDLCEEVWAQAETPPFCPACGPLMKSSVEPAGFTVGEAREVGDRFGVDVPIFIPKPIPLELVQLSTLPEDTWVGMPVFHPCEQSGEGANWHRYDVGIVIEVYPDPHFEGMRQCRFLHGVLGSGNGTLHYAPNWLWVPKVLADRVHRG